jgi:hypothetical protein
MFDGCGQVLSCDPEKTASEAQAFSRSALIIEPGNVEPPTFSHRHDFSQSPLPSASRSFTGPILMVGFGSISLTNPMWNGGDR